MKAPWNTKDFRKKAFRACRHYGLISTNRAVKRRTLWMILVNKIGESSALNILGISERVESNEERKIRRAVNCGSKTNRQPAVDFYRSEEWKRLRYTALKKHGAVCQCCGAHRSPTVQIHVDHVKPRSKYPALALDLSNLQILCEPCNIGKGAWDDTDWREQETTDATEVIWGDTWGNA